MSGGVPNSVTGWVKDSLASICTVVMGQSPLGEFYNVSGVGIPLAQGNADIRDRATFTRVWTSSAPKTCEKGDVVMTVRAPVGSIALAHSHIALGRGVCAFRNPKISRDFLYQTLIFAESRWEALAQGSTFTAANALEVASFLICYPESKAEQLAIAELLTDTDSLIEDLDKLIAKKRAIKQGAMQQLLTCKTQLPGFSEVWKTTRIGDHATFLRTLSYSRDQLSKGEEVAYLHYGDIHVGARYRLDAIEAQMPGISRNYVRNASMLNVGDLIFVDASEDTTGIGKSVEITHVPSGGLVSGLHTIAVRFDKKVLADGYKAYLQEMPTFRDHLLRLAAGTKVLATSKSHVASAEIALPGVEEQKVIAQVLIDMDAEIDALVARREKTALIKTGMMQELLTGRTRLV